MVFDGNNNSMSLGGNEVAQVLQDAPATQLLGHSELTASLSRWHAAHVLSGKTLVWASLTSTMLRDQILRPALLDVVSADAKTFLRVTYPHDEVIFPLHVATLHSWRFKDEDVWSTLPVLELKLSSKKPRNKPIRDWWADVDLWCSQHLALASADIDSNNDHLWIMRCLETCSTKLWYHMFRKDMAHDEARGVTITNINDLWCVLEFEEVCDQRSSTL